MHCNHSRLKLAVLRIARERYHVADVLHTGDEEHQTLETETETAVRNRAVFTGVHIPVHAGQSKLLYTFLQLLIILLSLATADNLTDFRESTSIARTVLPSSLSFI